MTTTQTAHTPGPWSAGSADAPEYMGDLPAGSMYIEAAGHDVIAEIDPCGVPLPEHRANARLIAAAPDLLAALRKIATLAEFGEEDGAMDLGQLLIDINRLAEAVIARTTGE